MSLVCISCIFNSRPPACKWRLRNNCNDLNLHARVRAHDRNRRKQKQTKRSARAIVRYNGTTFLRGVLCERNINFITTRFTPLLPFPLSIPGRFTSAVSGNETSLKISKWRLFPGPTVIYGAAVSGLCLVRTGRHRVREVKVSRNHRAAPEITENHFTNLKKRTNGRNETFQKSSEPRRGTRTNFFNNTNVVVTSFLHKRNDLFPLQFCTTLSLCTTREAVSSVTLLQFFCTSLSQLTKVQVTLLKLLIFLQLFQLLP